MWGIQKAKTWREEFYLWPFRVIVTLKRMKDDPPRIKSGSDWEDTVRTQIPPTMTETNLLSTVEFFWEEVHDEVVSCSL